MSNLERLDRLIPVYAQDNAQLKEQKKVCDAENAEIKAIMTDLVLTNYEAGGYVASVSTSERTKMNEDMMLEIVRNFGLEGVIKTKEYIDYVALEKAIYDDKVSEEMMLEMDKAREVTKVTTLRISKAKKKKGEE